MFLSLDQDIPRAYKEPTAFSSSLHVVLIQKLFPCHQRRVVFIRSAQFPLGIGLTGWCLFSRLWLKTCLMPFMAQQLAKPASCSQHHVTTRTHTSEPLLLWSLPSGCPDSPFPCEPHQPWLGSAFSSMTIILCMSLSLQHPEGNFGNSYARHIAYII